LLQLVGAGQQAEGGLVVAEAELEEGPQVEEVDRGGAALQNGLEPLLAFLVIPELAVGLGQQVGGLAPGGSGEHAVPEGFLGLGVGPVLEQGRQPAGSQASLTRLGLTPPALTGR
jgi:hypothetical protein